MAYWFLPISFWWPLECQVLDYEPGEASLVGSLAGCSERWKSSLIGALTKSVLLGHVGSQAARVSVPFVFKRQLLVAKLKHLAPFWSASRGRCVSCFGATLFHKGQGNQSENPAIFSSSTPQPLPVLGGRGIYAPARAAHPRTPRALSPGSCAPRIGGTPGAMGIRGV